MMAGRGRVGKGTLTFGGGRSGSTGAVRFAKMSANGGAGGRTALHDALCDESQLKRGGKKSKKQRRR